MTIRAYVPGRWSMSVEEARAILSRSDVKLIPEWVLSEARKVVTEGKQYWIFT